MDRLERAALLLRLVEELHKKGSPCGQAHLQKAAYFAQCLMDVPLGFRFVLYRNGPFSFDLRDECTALRADCLLRFGSIRSWGPEIEATDRKEYIDGIFHDRLEPYNGTIAFVAETIGDKGGAQLERLGTALFVTLDGEMSSPIEDRCRRVTELKPHITRESARTAVEEIDAIIEASKAHAFAR